MSSNLLLETGDALLLEIGDNLLLEDAAAAPPSIAYGDQTRRIGSFTAIDATNTGGAMTSASLQSGTLPSGLTLDTDGTATGVVGRIYGTPDTIETQSGIVIRGTNAEGNGDSPAFAIEIVAALAFGGADAPFEVFIRMRRPVESATFQPFEGDPRRP